jgi:hypothetical protein
MQRFMMKFKIRNEIRGLMEGVFKFNGFLQ